MFEVFEELDKFNGIEFEEESHSYIYNDVVCVSTTTLLNKYKSPFETDIIANKYAIKHNLDVEDVIKEWEDKKNSAANRGTHLHKYAEMKFACKKYSPTEEELPFKLRDIIDSFYSDSIGRLIPVRSELVIGDYELAIGGMIDQLFYNVKSNELQIWDYKTNKEISTYNKYKKRMINGLEHLHECEFNTYSLQLAIYKKIIEKNTNLKLGNSYICWVNENNDTYKTFKTKEMSKEVGLILNNITNEHIISLF